MALKFCANLNFLFTEKGGNLLDKYRLAKSAGFKGVESGFPIGIPVGKVVDVKNETGLQHVLVNICTEGTEDMKFGCAAFPGAEEQFKENLQKTINFAKAVNCSKIHIMAGKCLSPPTEQHKETYIKNLSYAAKQLEEANLTGLIEPINKYALPGYFLNCFVKAIDVLKSVNSANLKLMVDIFHLQMIEGNVTNNLNELKSYIGHVQIAQAPHRHEPNVPGELDFSYIFQAIENAGYKGWVGCEYTPKTNSLDGLGWVEQYGYTL